MLLKEYIENLQKIVERNPEYENLEVVYSVDDEGNGYGGINYTPTLGFWNEDDNFISADSEDFNEGDPINVICIN
jgi:hypothetical protein